MNNSTTRTFGVAAIIAFCFCANLSKGDNVPASKPRTTPELVADAVAALHRAEYSEAAAQFDEARKRPDIVAVRPPFELILSVGDHHFAQGGREEQDQALLVYAMAQEIYGASLSPFDTATTRVRRAEVLARQGRMEQARDEIIAIRQDPRLKDDRRAQLMADLGQADLHLAQNQAEAARGNLESLSEAEDAVVSPLAMFSLGRAYVQLNEPDKAVATFRTLWNRYGESDWVKRAVFIAGQVYFDQGDFLEARKLYEACSVVGAAMQTRVRPGNDLVIKVTDRDYFAKTHSTYLPVTVTVPSGDIETVKLEKNRVSDQLYIGRITTALASPAREDGTLQVVGSDTIEVKYGTGTSIRSFKIMVVDDGTIDIAGAPLPPPRPRHAKHLEPIVVRRTDGPTEPPPIIPTGRAGADVINPGSPVYVQVVDADLDLTDQSDAIKAQVVVNAPGSSEPISTADIMLHETGPHTGVFAGSVQTGSARPLISAGSEQPGHPVTDALGPDATGTQGSTTRPTTAPAIKPGYWMASPDATAWLQIDLHRPVALGKLTWGAGSAAADGNVIVSLRVILAGPAGERKILVTNQGGKPDGHIVDLGGTVARTVRVEIDSFNGKSPAIGQLGLIDSTGRPLLADGVERGDSNKPDIGKDVLLFDVGQTISARYMDEKNETPGIPIMRHSRSLGAGFHDGTIALARSVEDPATQESQLHAAWRLDRDALYHIVVNDPDMDTTIEPDTLEATVFTESGIRRTLTLKETGPATGTFTAAIPIISRPDGGVGADLIYVPPGELMWLSYLDSKNLHPGYRTVRTQWIPDNRPTVGGFLSLPLVTTAWPYEVKPAEDGTMRIVAPEPGKGRVTIAVHDPDAVPDASQKLLVNAQGLIGGGSAELSLIPSAQGSASAPLDLILSDKDVDRPTQTDPGTRGTATSELGVAGDDIIRMAYEDVASAVSDEQLRPVMTEEQLKALATASATGVAQPPPPAIPTLTLENPLHRVMAEQSSRLSDLRSELGRRVIAYKAELELTKACEKFAQVRLAKENVEPREKVATTSPASPAEQSPLQRQVAAIEANAALLTARIDRLTALGAKQPAAGDILHPLPTFGSIDATKAPEPTAASTPDPLRIAMDGPIMPGTPFDVVINDPDYVGDTLHVRIRSLAGGLVDRQVVSAKRAQSGVYRIRISTRLPDASSPATQPDESQTVLSVLPGGEILADYEDPKNIPSQKAERVTYLALGSDATLAAMNSNYFEEVTQIRLGEPIYIQIVDHDADRSAAPDQVTAIARSDRGDQLLVTLTETEPHSGIFRGKFVTDNGQPNPDDDILQAAYGGSIELAYHDVLRETSASPEWKMVRLHVMGGTDGTVEAFTRRFDDPQQELQLWYKTGQAAYEVGRKLYAAGSLGRAEQYLGEATGYFTQLVTRVPDNPLAASSNYYLGNIRSLRGEYREALGRYQEVVARWPKSDFVPRARFKIGECYEQLGQFDSAADAYVLLTYHHPNDSHVPTAMIRMMNHFAGREQWIDAVSVAKKFVEKFPQHEQAGGAALKAGQWLAAAGDTRQAVEWFVESEKAFAKNDRDMPALLYWHAAILIQSGSGPESDKVLELLNRVGYDYPTSPYATLARSALEQLKAKN